MKIGIVLGTRPEIIKMSPIIDEIKNNGSEFIIIHTGQHYDIEMSQQFFIDLKLPIPNYNIGIGSNTAINQISIIISELEKILIDEAVDVVLVQGDTNAVLSGALAANKLKIPVGHIEAGLRSFDKNMPEEINRLIADNCSSLYFVPTPETGINLQNEGINHEAIHVTGNTIVDACNRNLKIALENSTVQDEIIFNEYILLTCHRAENVDDEERLRNIVTSLINIPYNIVFPIHPHTKKSLENLNLYEKIANSEHIQITRPQGYLDFLCLLSNSSLVLTDSGGVQEEAITLNIPCITLRYNTERPETISAGGNILVGTETNAIIENINNILNNEKIYSKMSNAINPYGNGTSAEQIYRIIKNQHDTNKLKITRANKIVDFEGYILEEISENITVEEYETINKDCIIEQVFYNGKPEYIQKKMNLKNRKIIIKQFKDKS
ncbi:non-hydrolyzing UDP-N-acetylglucosamine 2-epimerase [Methanosphaera sp. WGK6]|uniref:non-hydrolyzing UDP-N-acetylglucosamine 2-epimerase n=1 Tax=Methanosphaera sp. WGK6 TaxID=1561964 RepID=UPI00084C6EBF|nr:UDP-N-acetylglucosamine 2-epimerase (non-hydrolyzing) [Methanosphaera sp. WGK6]OED30068.1 UDP-N-acetylglucosamine 2-epimerase [Methanosphaera sp. WGK6]